MDRPIPTVCYTLRPGGRYAWLQKMQLTGQYISEEKTPQKIEKVAHKNDCKAMK